MEPNKTEGDQDGLPAPGPSPDPRAVAAATQARERRLDEQEAESFPASDPHSDWAGPPD